MRWNVSEWHKESKLEIFFFSDLIKNSNQNDFPGFINFQSKNFMKFNVALKIRIKKKLQELCEGSKIVQNHRKESQKNDRKPEYTAGEWDRFELKNVLA